MWLSLSLPLLLFSLACYVAVRFAVLGGWIYLAGCLRLLGMWGALAWIGYTTELYVAALIPIVAIGWRMLQGRWLLVVPYELLLAAGLVLFSQETIVPVFLAFFVLADQMLVRLFQVRFDEYKEPRVWLHRVLLLVGALAASALVLYVARPALTAYTRSHTPMQVLHLQPQPAARLWFHERQVQAARGGFGTYWEARLPTSGPRCLLAFHGAHRDGSLQSAMRGMASGAKMAGLRFYGVDHPGFGASPAPAKEAAVDDWDPAELTTPLLENMRRDGCESIVALGHSQGVTEALRLLVSNVPTVSQVFVLGAGLYSNDADSENYWHERFHIDRGLDFSSTPVAVDKWKLIRDLYYLNQEYCSDQPAGRAYEEHKPFTYVEFAEEHANLVATRETLWRCLDFPQKRRVELPSDHYLNALQIDTQTFAPRSAKENIAGLLLGRVNEK